MSHLGMNIIQSLAGLLAGGLIGIGFGKFQDAARKRYERLQLGGQLRNEWTVMRGSGQRIALFLLALVVVQAGCPLLFRDGTQWCVSAGVVAGYGWCLFRRLAR